MDGGNNVYYAWLRTVSATGVAPLARGTARSTGHFLIRLASSAHLDNQNTSEKIQHIS